MFKAAAAAAELEAIGVEAEIGVDRLAEGVEVTGATGAVAGGTRCLADWTLWMSPKTLDNSEQAARLAERCCP